MLELSSELFPNPLPQASDAVTAWYEGFCPATKQHCRLPRTVQTEAIARQLMNRLARDEIFSREGKMYGVLLVETPTGKRAVLKAFSGLLQGKKILPGWVPPMGSGDRLLLEEQQILAQLNQIRREIQTLEALPQRQAYQAKTKHWQEILDQFNQDRRQKKQARRERRAQLEAELGGDALHNALAQLQAESYDESNQKRDLKRQRDKDLKECATQVFQADERIRQLLQQRKSLSRSLQKRMHRVYSLKNFQGESRAIADLFPSGLPTGTGDCCAPKLLNYAANHKLKPLALAEFWWGKDSKGKQAGEFYLACEERCQPILGFLLSGLGGTPFRELVTVPELPFRILHEDAHLLVIHKPAGLATIPGRSSRTYDSVLSRLRRDRKAIYLVHRLDQDTSGVLLFAKTPEAQHHLQKQFKARTIHKEYQAILEADIALAQGTICLPLWGNPRDRPFQSVHYQLGKPSETHFKKVGARRLLLKPITGRTHQLRVHCAHPEGLGIPIFGDRLYGTQSAERLHLQATAISFAHPHTQKTFTLRLEAEF